MRTWFENQDLKKVLLGKYPPPPKQALLLILPSNSLTSPLKTLTLGLWNPSNVPLRSSLLCRNVTSRDHVVSKSWCLCASLQSKHFSKSSSTLPSPTKSLVIYYYFPFFAFFTSWLHYIFPNPCTHPIGKFPSHNLPALNTSYTCGQHVQPLYCLWKELLFSCKELLLISFSNFLLDLSSSLLVTITRTTSSSPFYLKLFFKVFWYFPHCLDVFSAPPWRIDEAATL